MKGKAAVRHKNICCLIGSIFLVLAPCWAGSKAPVEPTEPKPSPSVQQILDESDRFTQENQLEKALQATERAAATAESEEDLAGKAYANRSRALLFQALGRTDAAITAWQETATAWERLGDGPGVIEALASAGLLLMPDKSAQAEAQFARVFALAPNESRRPLAEAQKLHAAARSSYERRYFDLASKFWVAALSIDEKVAPNSLQTAEAIHGVGSVAYQLGEVEKAGQYYQQALALRQKLAPDSLEMAMSLNAVGNVARKQGDLAKAEQY